MWGDRDIGDTVTFVNAAHADGNAVTSVAPSVPASVADGDLLLTFLKSTNAAEADPSTVPSGWTQVAKAVPAGSSTYWVYYKIAASESGSYTWGWAGAARRAATVVAYRDGFSISSVSDFTVSNTTYITANTTVRAASFSVPSSNSPLIWIGSSHFSSAQTLTTPTVPTGWASDVDDNWSSASRGLREIASMTWSSSGATGDIDSTLSTSNGDKHAFALALNPSTSASKIQRLLVLGVG